VVVVDHSHTVGIRHRRPSPSPNHVLGFMFPWDTLDTVHTHPTFGQAISGFFGYLGIKNPMHPDPKVQVPERLAALAAPAEHSTHEGSPISCSSVLDWCC
jgi:hypothetical protein